MLTIPDYLFAQTAKIQTNINSMWNHFMQKLTKAEKNLPKSRQSRRVLNTEKR